jgi:hypothetical protein
VVLSLGLSSVYGQVDDSQIPPLSVKTELPLYDQGDSVVFSGKVKNPDASNLIDVTLRVIGPLVNGTSSNIVQVKQIKPQLDGSFEGAFIVSGPLWKAKGDYKIIVNYGPQKAETTFFYNGGTGETGVDVEPPEEPVCEEGQVIRNGVCVTPEITPQCGAGTHLEDGVCVPDKPTIIECEPGFVLVGGECIPEEPEEPEQPVCGPGTVLEGGICVPEKKEEPPKGCLIATAAFGSELAPQVQLLREVRDNVLFGTSSGTSFMTTFNAVYYTFSPTVADWERENPAFKELVKTAVTPMLSTLSILNYVDIDSEQEMLGYGIGIILLNIGMYFVAPAIVIVKLRGLINKRRP